MSGKGDRSLIASLLTSDYILFSLGKPNLFLCKCKILSHIKKPKLHLHTGTSIIIHFPFLSVEFSSISPKPKIQSQ